MDEVNNKNMIRGQVRSGVLMICAAMIWTWVSGVPSGARESTSIFEILLTMVLIAACVWLVAKEVMEAKRLLETSRVEATLGEMLNYRLECWWANKPYALALSLVYVIFLMNLVGGVLFAVATGQRLGSSMFAVWNFLSDPGALASGEYGSGGSAISFFMTVAGIVFFGFMISLTTDYVADKVAQIKKGNSRVIESGHTVILGYSSHLRPLILQIALANESEGGGTVVVLVDPQQHEIMQKVLQSIGSGGSALTETTENALKCTRIVVRLGSPLEFDDLRIVSVDTARVVICLADNEVSADESDAFVMRTSLVLSAFPKVHGHVVAEIRDIDNKERIELTSGHRTECIVAHDLIGRLMVQCARHRGLAGIVEELLGFEGDEFYTNEWPSLVGLNFLQVQRAFDYATPVGIVFANGQVVINPQPAASVVVAKGDKIIVVAEDNDTYAPLPDGPIPLEVVDREVGDRIRLRREPTQILEKSEREHFLFLGWRRDVMDMIHFLDDLVPPGSTLTIMSMLPVRKRYMEMSENGRKLELRNLTLDHVVGNHVSRRQLKAIPLRRYSAILVLSEKSLETETASKDSISTAAVVLVRDILEKELGPDHYQRYRRSPENNNFHCTLSPPPVGDVTEAEDEDSTLARVVPPLDEKYDVLKAIQAGLGQTVDLIKSPIEQMFEEHRRKHGRRRHSDDDRDDDVDDDDHSETGDFEDLMHQSTSGRDPRASAEPPPAPATSPAVGDPNSSSGGLITSSSSSSLADTLFAATNDDNNSGAQRPSLLSLGSKLKREEPKRTEAKLKRQLSLMKDPTTNSRKKPPPILICELLDSRMSNTLSRFCDIVASNDCMSRILAMVSECSEINQTITQLLAARSDSTLMIQPATLYVDDGEILSFYQLSLRLQECGDILMGYLTSHDAGDETVTLNPRDKLALITWGTHHRLTIIGCDKRRASRERGSSFAAPSSPPSRPGRD